MDEIVSTKKLKADMLSAIKASGKDLNAASLILFTAPGSITEATLPDAIVPATFDGYAQADALVFGTPYRGIDGKTRMNAPSVDFVCTGSGVSETIVGWALMKADLTELYGAKILEDRVPITMAGQGLTVEPSVVWGE